jgi:hypothetical protein
LALRPVASNPQNSDISPKNEIEFDRWFSTYEERLAALPRAYATEDMAKIWAARSKLHFAREQLWLEARKIPHPVLHEGIVLYDILSKRVFRYSETVGLSADERERLTNGMLVQLAPLLLSSEVRDRRDALVVQLRSRSPEERVAALIALKAMENEGLLEPPYEVPDGFQHGHSTFSYSFYPPEALIWRGYQLGLQVNGIVDHDTVNGFGPFLNAAAIAGARNPTCGYEVRATPVDTDFMHMDINFPGVKGIMYLVVHGVDADENPQLDAIREAKIKGFNNIIAAINQNLTALGLTFQVSYEEDVRPLTEDNNPTERHLAEGIATKFNEGIPDTAARIEAVRSLCAAITRQTGMTVTITDEEAQSIDNPVKFLTPVRKKIILPLRQLYPLTIEECPPVQDIVDYAHAHGWWVYYPALFGGANACVAESPANRNRLMQYCRRIGMDGIAFMFLRNTDDDVAYLEAAGEDFERGLCNGGDVNADEMSFTDDVSARPDLVAEALAIVAHEGELRGHTHASSGPRQHDGSAPSA